MRWQAIIQVERIIAQRENVKPFTGLDSFKYQMATDIIGNIAVWQGVSKLLGRINKTPIPKLRMRGAKAPAAAGAGREAAKNAFPTNESQLQHIFRDAEGHILDTPANHQLLLDVADDATTTLGTDRLGNVWSARTLEDGTQVWVQTRNGVIQNGGINATPRTFNSQTGLSGGAN